MNAIGKKIGSNTDRIPLGRNASAHKKTESLNEKFLANSTLINNNASNKKHT